MKIIILMIVPFFLASCEFEAEDKTAPKITLIGNAEESVDMNESSRLIIDSFLDVGSATVTDNLDDSVAIGSSKMFNSEDKEIFDISIKVPGEYKIIYYAEDASGNKATAERSLSVRDLMPPQIFIEKLHDESKHGPMPASANEYSIKIPRGTEFDEADILYGVTMKDVWSVNNGIESMNPVNPVISYKIISSPRTIVEGVFSFDVSGEYLIEYKAVDKDENESIFNRSVFVSDDTERPELTCGDFEVEPLDNMSEANEDDPVEGGDSAGEEEKDASIEEEERLDFLRRVATEGCEVRDSFYPYNRFSSDLEGDASGDDLTDEEKLRMSRHIIVSVLEDHPAYAKNITPTALTRPTGGSGILVPIAIIDESNGYDSNEIKFRKVIIKDVTPPTLARDIPGGVLSVEIDASLTAAEIKEKIVNLSSDKNNLDDYVEFLDKENENIPLYVESIKDANGTEILLLDNSLNYNSMSDLPGPLTVLYTTNDGFDCEEDNLLCGNAPSEPVELRTRNIELLDTTSPIIELPKIAGLDTEPFFSFEQSLSTEYIDYKKTILLSSGDVVLLDNSTQNPHDISISAKVTTTNNPTCQVVSKELDFSCDGVHKILLSATDTSLHVGEYERELTIYIYNKASKDSFEEIFTKTIDSFGNEISTFKTGVNYGTGIYDLGNVVTDIEAISMDSSFDPRLIKDVYFYDIPLTNSFTNSMGNSYGVDIDYRSIESNYFRYYVSLDGKDKISFNRPQNKEKYIDPLNGLDVIPGDGVYNSLVKFRVTVGNYSELVGILIKAKAYTPISPIKNVIIPVYPRYTVEGPKFLYRSDEIGEIKMNEDASSYGTDLISKTFYDDNIASVRDFLDLNTSGVYPFEPAIYTPNNGVNRPGVGVLVIDNREQSIRHTEDDKPPVFTPDYIVDETGQLKPKYHKILSDFLRGVPEDLASGTPRIPGLIETSDGFREILNSQVSDPVKVSELNVFFIVVDSDIKLTPEAFAVKPYSNPHTYDTTVPSHEQGSKYSYDRFEPDANIVDDHKCLSEGVYVNAPRGYLELKPLCKVDGGFYYNPNSILDEADQVPVEINIEGDISGDPVDAELTTHIWSIFQKVSTDPETGEETTEEIEGWCPTATPDCEPTKSDARIALEEYDLVSDLYHNKQVELESELSKALEVSAVAKDYESGVIRHLIVPAVGGISTGDFLTRLSIEGLIAPLENKVNVLKNYHTPDSEGVEVVVSDGNYYTMPYETTFSFLSSGFLAKKTQDDIVGTNPHNLSAYDKEKIASNQPVQLSYNDMKDNKKVYEYNLKAQSKDNNATILKIKFSENEYFLVEKRTNESYDSSSSVKIQEREELEDGSLSETISETLWKPNSSGILVWHVEQENGGEMVDLESGVLGIYGANYKLKPGDQSTSASSNTNDNEGKKTGIVINIDENLNVKVCHDSVGADSSQSYYDSACDVEK